MSTDTPERTAPREWQMNIGTHNVIVDYDMLPILKQFTWYVYKSKSTYYVVTNIRIGEKQVRLPMHRLLTGIRAGIVDHRNRNGLDNRMENLRFATAKQNSCNRVRKNSSGYRGVYKRPEGTFAMQIQIDGRKMHMGGFKTAEEAARAYDDASKEYHGEFGIRNFKD